MHDQDARFASNQCDRNEVVERMKLQLRIQRRTDRIGLRSEQKRVAIRRGLRGELGTDRRPAPRFVFNDDLLAQTFRKFLGNDPRRAINRAAGRRGTMIRIGRDG